MIRILSIIIALVFAKTVSAQYKELLVPQPEEEIKKFKKLGVKFEFVSPSDGEETNYVASYVDSTGHKILIQKPKQKTYFKYDEEGRLIAKLDSINYKDSIIRLAYYADYSAAGKLSLLRTPNAVSVFRYDAKKRILEEQYSGKSGDEQNRFYRFDGSDRIIEEEFCNPDGKVMKMQKFTYNKNGKLEKETILDAEPDGSHTFYGVTYSYDKKENLTSKQVVTVFNHEGDNPDPNVRFVPKYRTRNFTYVYDDKGNLLKEILTNVESPNSNYTLEKKYDNNGLVILEETLDYKKIVRLSYNHKYEFYKTGK